MLRALLASSGVLQIVKAGAAARLQRTLTLVVCGYIALLMLFLAMVALGTAAAVALEPETGAARAIAIVGGAALLIGLLILAIGIRLGQSPAGSRSIRSPAEAATVAAFPEMGFGHRWKPGPWVIAAVILGLLMDRSR